MIQRTISKKILELRSKYPVIAITGPRQSGKTILAQELFPDYEYHNLENVDALSVAKQDPKSFLKTGSGQRMIIDEIQKLPELLSYLQVEVDAQKIDGQFVITGSQNFAISEHISQSLAGRVADFTLLPLSYTEVRQSKYADHFTGHKQCMLQGFYPRALVKAIKPVDFFRDYLSTYVERDVRQIKNIGDLALFQKFLQLLAGRVGQLLNYSSLSNDVGVTFKTIESWLSILEASYIVYRLQPYYENYGKRVMKTPKVYFYDIGLLCYLLRINSQTELTSHFAYGQIFENFIITELLKNQVHLRKNEKSYFWRTSNATEVDVIIDRGGIKQGIEIKAAQTFNTDMLKGLTQWRNLNPDQNGLTVVVYTGEIEQKILDHQILNWQTFLNGITE